MRRPYKKEETALLNEMSRSSNPTQQAREQLAYELEQKNPEALRAFIAEHVALRQLRDVARAQKRYRLPLAVQAALDRLARAKSFDHLVEMADAPLSPVGREPGAD